MSSDFESLLASAEASAPRLLAEPPLRSHLAGLLHAIYATAVDEPELLERLLASWPVPLHGFSELDGWFELARFAARTPHEGQNARETLGAAVAHSPRFDAWLLSAEATRLVSLAQGQAAGWELACHLRVFDHLVALQPPATWQRESSLVMSCMCSLISLAAANGDWHRCDRITALADAWWPGGPASTWPRLARADADIARGRYAKALTCLEEISRQSPERAGASIACTRLHALVALGAASEEPAHAALLWFVEQVQVLADADTAGMRLAQQLSERVRQLVRPHPALVAAIEDSDLEDFLLAKPTPVRGLFEREQRSKRYSGAERGRRLKQLLADVSDAIEAGITNDRQDGLRLRLLWCRLIVDTNVRNAFTSCEMLLALAIEEATALGALPLLMLAHDQRSVLRAQLSPIDWRGALTDSAEAARIASTLLEANASEGGGVGDPSRGFLESLLPVFDRVVELHAIGALNLFVTDGSEQQRPDAFNASLLTTKSAQGAWQRFGRKLHAYAEQAQLLALDAARVAREQSRRFGRATFVDSAAPHMLEDMQRLLRRQDAILQYFMVGSYVLTFAYGQSFFDWYLESLDTPDSSEHALLRLLDELRSWTQGGAPDSPDSLVRLEQLVLPKALVQTLERAHVMHLRIVPYGALYRVPFGRLKTTAGSLAQRYSLSLHPTGRLATKSAARRHVVPRGIPVAHVVGPEQESPFGPIDCSGAERDAIAGGLGGVVALGRLQPIDAWQGNPSRVLEQLHAAPVLHFLCHGHEGNDLGQLPGLRLAPPGAPLLDSGSIAQLRLERCALVVLQACWTGWMDHERRRPVQGIPQAFCDAGAWGVVAPLTQVPKALAAPFSGVFYRALRFLPPELALRRALQLLRSHATTLLAGDAAGLSELARLGTFDSLEYRYTGATDIWMGHWASRLIGRLAFWWYERTLSKRRALPPA